MTLVDTSVWVDHFRNGNRDLEELLLRGLAGIHPLIIGELACGNLRRRNETMRNLRQLPAAAVADDGEVHHLLETRRLWGKGLGWTDLHLLAAAALSGWTLWTLDGALARAAAQLRV